MWTPRIVTWVEENGLPNARIEYVDQDGNVMVPELTGTLTGTEEMDPVTVVSTIIDQIKQEQEVEQ